MENTAEGEAAQIDESRCEQAKADADDNEKEIGHDGCIDFFQHWVAPFFWYFNYNTDVRACQEGFENLCKMTKDACQGFGKRAGRSRVCPTAWHYAWAVYLFK